MVHCFDVSTFYELTTGIKEMMLYFWLRITLGGNFWLDSRPTKTVLAASSFLRQHNLQNMLQHLKWECKMAIKFYF